MSTQLILYPQTYEGYNNSVSSASLTEYLTNGINFTGINSTPDFATASSTPMQAAINSSQLVLGSWYRLHTTGGLYDATVAPLITGGELFLFFGTPSNGVSGLYQRLSGLAIGGQYDVVVNISTPASGMVNIRIFNGTVQTASMFVTANLNTITYTFTSPSTSPTFLISYIGKTPGSLGLESISIKDTQFAPGGVNSELSDGQVICDLYAEEEIPLTLSIDEFKNVAEKVQSYSKDFNLPATKRNNQIFNNMFEITRSYDDLIFNPYIKTQCVLKQDGFILFEGYLRMINVKEQDGEISYNVNLYSDVIALADVLKDQTFAELDFSELTHQYNKTSIQDSWYEPATGTGLPLTNPLSTSSFAYDALLGASQTNVLKYPFIDWTGSIPITSNTNASSGPTPNNPELPTLEAAFRPCIQLKYLINKIFAASGFNWTSNFFDSEDFEKLFMDFNWSSNDSAAVLTNMHYIYDAPTLIQIGTTWTTYQLNQGTFSSLLNYDTANNKFVSLNDNAKYDIDYEFAFDVNGFKDLDFRWVQKNSAGSVLNTFGVVTNNTSSVTAQMTGNFTAFLDAGDTLEAQAQTPSSTSPNWYYQDFTGIGATVTAVVNADAIGDEILSQLRGELGQWDFLKGIMTMFNLVSMVDENNAENILIEPYADVFINNTAGTNLAARSIQHDWTNKVDASEMELTPLTNLNKNTIFKFVEDEDDYVFRQYKKSTSGYLYGSLNWEAQAGFTILAGEKEIIAEPFAATVSKPLDDQFATFITPCIYAKADDGTNEGFENSPRIFYNNGIKDTGISYYMPPQNGVASSNQPEFLQFSHLSSIPPGTIAAGRRDFVFTSQQLFAPIGNSPVANLFNTYWLPYFNELYNPDTRTMTIKVDLSPSDINTFRFYDKCQIKNRTFRVNKIQYKPNELATVEFILIP